MEEKLQFQECTPPEKFRTYIYPKGEVTIPNVARVCVRPSGGHRLETTDGAKYIINSGWLAIRLDIDSWSF